MLSDNPESAQQDDGVPNKLERGVVYFRPIDPETKKTRTRGSRAFIVDLEPCTTDVFKASAVEPLFKPDNMVNIV